MTEAEFIESIDCRFPYGDETRWRSVIEQGASISPNASFMVLHELCRPPKSAGVKRSDIESMLSYWHQHFRHPLIEIVLPAAKAMIDGKELPVPDCMEIMRAVAPYREQYNALAIPYFACDDVDEKADELYRSIIESWGKD